jgi:hypothetical protein
MNYIVLAWQPGSYRFIAKVGDELGFLDAASGHFEPNKNPRLVEAATTKYHYRRLGPYEVAPHAMKQFAEDLVWP